MFHVKHPMRDDVPAAAIRIFGDAVDRAARYVEILGSVGVVQGLIGPREVGRLWDRHVLNCAVLSELVEPGRSVVDIGTGAGLPGIPLALARPDLDIAMVEPMGRRAAFVAEVIAELDLRARVHRGRAEDADVQAAVGRCDVATSRAVAPLDRLAAYSLPLLARGGRLMAIKGEKADTEIADHRGALGRLGVTAAEVVQCGVGITDRPTIVVVARYEGRSADRRGPRPRRTP